LKAIAREGEGMFSKVVRGWWRIDSGSGSSPGTPRTLTSRYHLKIGRPTSILCRLQGTSAERSVAASFSMFELLPPSNILGKQVLSGGPYSDRPSGVADGPHLIPGPATYVVVLSCLGHDHEAEYEFTAYSSSCAVGVEAI